MRALIEHYVALSRRRVAAPLRAVLVVAFPLLFIALFVIAPGWWASRRFDIPMELGASKRLAIGGAFVGLGGALYLWTIVLFARARGTQVPVAPTQELVTGGPYAVSRNPMVTSAILMVVGAGVLAGSWSYVLAGLVIPLHYLLYIKLFEEVELEARFGDDYVAYRASTPFIVPRWPARRVSR